MQMTQTVLCMLYSCLCSTSPHVSSTQPSSECPSATCGQLCADTYLTHSSSRCIWLERADVVWPEPVPMSAWMQGHCLTAPLLTLCIDHVQELPQVDHPTCSLASSLRLRLWLCQVSSTQGCTGAVQARTMAIL
jgi:hypothetical protein